MPIIDSHCLLGVWPRSSADLSLEALARPMEARAVAKAVAVHTSAIFYDQAAGNREIEAMARDHRALVPAAVLNPLNYPGCLEEAARCLGAGIRCFRFYPALHGYTLSADLAALGETLAALAGARLLQFDCGAGVLEGIGERFCELLPAPAALAVESGHLGLALAAARQCERLLIETSRLTATGAIDAAARTLGVQRLVFGSGAPLMSLGSALLSVQYAELSEPGRAAVLEGNLSRLLA